MSDYLSMSMEDLEELKERLLSQRDNMNNTIEEVLRSIKIKRLQLNEKSLILNPYYRDNSSYLKVTINSNSHSEYTITKITPCGKCPGIYTFSSDNTGFLKYYKMCAKSEWDSVVDRFNTLLKDSSLKVEEL